MGSLRPENIRSIAVVGHKGAGKTALIEAMGYIAKALPRLGKPGDRGLGLDDTPEEKSHLATFETRVASLNWAGARLYLLDTPGEAGFFTETQMAFAAADAVLLVVSARAGVETGTEKLARLVLESKKPCLVAITRCDDEQARVEEVVQQVRDLKEPITVVEVPHHKGAALDGVVNVASMKAWVGHPEAPDHTEPDSIPEEMTEEVRRTREKLVDDVAGTDDALTEHYLNDGDLKAGELKEGEHRAVARGALVPVLYTSATAPFGIVALLDALVDFAPSPVDLPAWKGTHEGIAVTRERKPDAPLSAFVVKTRLDAHGRMSLLRVVSGTLKPESFLICASTQEKERIGAIQVGTLKEAKAVTDAIAGELVLVPKLKTARTGETLCEEKQPVVLDVPQRPITLFSRAVISSAKASDDKIAQVLHTLHEEDPGLQVGYGADGHQLVMSGLGAVHLDVTLERLKRRANVDVKLGPPRVEYRETITKTVKNVEGKQKKQTGGHGQFGVVYVDVEPLERGAGFVFEDAVVGGSVPRQFIGSVKKGVERALKRGIIAGYPVVDVKVRLVDGKSHSVDSSDAAFQIAGYRGFLAAARQAGPALLEPVAKLSLTVPAESMGDVIGDVASRNGSVHGREVTGDAAEIQAHLPFAQLMDYEPTLSAHTRGRGRFTFAFDHYDVAPPTTQAKVIRESGFNAAEDDED